jgi:hypothetical protein
MTSCQEVAARLCQAKPPARQVMKQPTNGTMLIGPGDGQECVIDLHWLQSAAGTWKAVLVNQATGERHEVSSTHGLREVLERLLAANIC